MMRQRLAPFSLVTLLLATSLLPAVAQADAVTEHLAETLSVNGQSMPVDEITETPMQGVYHVRLESGESFYSNPGGRPV